MKNLTDEEIIYEAIHGDNIDWTACSYIDSREYADYKYYKEMRVDGLSGPIKSVRMTHNSETDRVVLEVCLRNRANTYYDQRCSFECAAVRSKKLGEDYIKLFHKVYAIRAERERERKALEEEKAKAERRENDAAAREELINLLEK